MALLIALIGAHPSLDVASAAADGASVFIPVTPARLFDTSGTRLAAGVVKSLPVSTTAAGVPTGVPTSNVSAVVVDVAAKNTVASNVYVYSTDDSSPLAVLSVGAGDVRDSNTAIVKVGTENTIKLKVSSGSADVNVDIQGYFTATSAGTSAGGFVPISPSRIVNTLDGTGISQGKVMGGNLKTVQVGGRGGIPSKATAVFANIRVQNSSGSGSVRAGANSTAVASQAPVTDYTASGIYDSGASLDIDSSGKLYFTISSGTSANVTIDVQGYFTSGTDGAGFHPLGNDRVWDSRNSSRDAIQPGESRIISIAGLGGLPNDGRFGSVALTVTALNWGSASGSVSVSDADDDPPKAASGVAWEGSYAGTPAQTTAIVGALSSYIRIVNSSDDAVDVLLNAQGWFDPSEGLTDDIDEPIAPSELDQKSMVARAFVVTGSGAREYFPGNYSISSEQEDVSAADSLAVRKPLIHTTGWWESQCPSSVSGTTLSLISSDTASTVASRAAALSCTAGS